MARHTGGHASATYETSRIVSNTLRLIVIISCLVAIGAMIYGLQRPGQPGGVVSVAAPSVAPLASSPASSINPLPAVAPSVAPSAIPEPPVTPSPAVRRVGIIAGHWGYDVGAVCPDGLTEGEINLEVARRVVYILQALGYQADLLEEYDAHLTGYRADALVSIHTDSCEDFPNATPPASGFKVASVEDSLVPQTEARLVACLAQCYTARTKMFFHENSITPNMTDYHAFYDIDSQTPAAIIEIGFMRQDRELLTQGPDLVAQGIVEGIVCFFGE